jgi:hypothetical protein
MKTPATSSEMQDAMTTHFITLKPTRSKVKF